MFIERKLSMPFWCVGNPVGDPFGPGVMDSVDSLEIADLLAEAGKEGLIDFTAAHDDDLVPWDPNNPEDDLDTSSETYKTLAEIKKKLKASGVQYKMIGCALHPDPVFRNGGLTNPDARVRALAAKKVMRALRIGSFLGAEYFTYWVARDGFETQFSVPWDRSYGYIQDALNLVPRYCREKNLSIKHATIEHKPNEPRGEMFLPTVGHAIALIDSLDEPDFWGLNPEVLQHDQMTNLSPVQTVAFAIYMKKLFFLHIGAQKPGQFDNDNPPLIGMDGLKEMVSIIYLINKLGWEGHIEYDNHMLRTDTAPGEKNRIELRRNYIRLAVDAYRTAEKKAKQLLDNEELAKRQSEIQDGHQDIAKILKSGDPSKIAGINVDYNAVAEQPIKIGELDMIANKTIFGL